MADETVIINILEAPEEPVTVNIIESPDEPVEMFFSDPDSVPKGGAQGQVLSKKSNANYHTEWKNLSANDVGADTQGSAATAESSAKSYADTLVSTLSNSILQTLTYYATKAWVNAQGFITNVISALGYTPENAANKQTDLAPSAIKYPSVDAVIEGISTAMKGVRKLLFYQNTTASVTGTTAAYILTPNTWYIPGGTMGPNGIVHVEALCGRGSGTNAQIAFSALVNTSYSIPGAKAIHSTGSTLNTGLKTMGFQARTVNKNNVALNQRSPISSPFQDTATSNAISDENIDWSVGQYIMLVSTANSALDEAKLFNAQIYITNP